MLKLLKNEFKNRGKLIGILSSLYLIEHIYFIFFKLDKSITNITLVEIFMGNFFLSSIVLITIAFFFSFIDFGKSLKPKPGYMLYMTNMSKEKIVLSKILYSIIETGILTILTIITFLIELKYLNLISYFLGDFNKSLLIAIRSGLKQIFIVFIYIVISYILILVSVMLAITIRKFLIKDKPFSGIITFIILVAIALTRDFLIEIFNIPLSQSYTVHYNDINTGVNFTHKVSNLSIQVISFDLILVILVTFATINIIKKKLSI